MRLRSAFLTVSCALSLAAVMAPRQAHAQSDADRATARALGQEGQTALEAKDYVTAEDRYRRAEKILNAPTLLLGLARALTAEGKFVEAQESYNKIIRDGVSATAPDVFKKALEDAKKEVEAVTPKVGTVNITVKAAGGTDIADPQVVLDEHPINSASLGVRRAIDPGAHVLRAAADGYKPGELKFSVPEGGSVDSPLILEKDLAAPVTAAVPVPNSGVAMTPAPEAGPSKARRMAPIVAFGVGGAGLVFGAVTGVLAIGKHSTLTDECPGGTCSTAASKSDLDSYHAMGTLSTVGFIVAGVGAAAGVVLLVTQPKGDSGPPPATASGFRIAPVVGLGSLGAAGTF